MLQLCDLLQNNWGGKPQKHNSSLVHHLCITSVRAHNVSRCHRPCGAACGPHEPGWSWTPFSGFFIWKPGGFTQDVRSGAALPSVRQTIITGSRFNANEPLICWDYLHERLLWHIQPTISRKTLNIIWWILRAIKPLQPLTSRTQNLKTLSQKQSVLQHKSNHTL